MSPMSTGPVYHDGHFRRVYFGPAASKEGCLNVVHVISVIKSVAKSHLTGYFITCPI